MTGFLRKMKESDLRLVRDWRNAPEVNRYMFSQHEITQKEHQNWFDISQNNPMLHLNVYEENGVIKGFLQLQNKVPEANVYEWGFYISPDAPRGTGANMTKLALKKVFEDMRGKKLFAKVLAFNERSKSLHEKLGFAQEGVLREQHYLNGKYYDVYCFGMLKPQWLELQS